MHATSTANTDLNWYPDSGAAHHVTGNASNLHDVVDYHGPDTLMVSNLQVGKLNLLDPLSFQMVLLQSMFCMFLTFARIYSRFLNMLMIIIVCLSFIHLIWW